MNFDAPFDLFVYLFGMGLSVHICIYFSIKVLTVFKMFPLFGGRK